jgi:phosphoglycolate phosphatase-like HAD superfamily hydrolase
VTGLRYVVFDLDDTLIGTAAASFAAAAAAARRLGLTPPDREAFDRGYRELPFQECVERWFGPGVDFADFSASYWDAVRYRALGDVPALVRGLRSAGVPAGIVTNSTGTEAVAKLASAGIDGALFDFVAGRPDGVTGVPPEKDLAGLLGDRRIDPGTAVHVSDNPVDFAPSARAGLPFRGVLTGVWTAADFAAAGVPADEVHPDVHAAVRAAA